MGGNGNDFSGINGNGIIILDIQLTGNGNRSEVWEWEGWVLQKSFPHTSSLKLGALGWGVATP